MISRAKRKSFLAVPQITHRGVLRLAAIDVGSNSIHMVIAQVDADGSTTTLWRVREMVGLGRASFPSHRLSTEAMDLAILTIARFSAIARRRGAEQILAAATSAVREAENGIEFIERVRNETGVSVRIVSAREEARFIYTGVRHAAEFGRGKNLIIDIGGGSVEAIVADHEKPLLLESRKLGAARMTAMFVHSDPPRRSEIDQLLRHYEQQMDPLLGRIRKMAISRVIGCSGTLENLAMMCASGKAPGDDQPLELKRPDLDDLLKELLKMDAADRERIKGLDQKRQDQILAGALLIHLMLHKLGQKRLIISSAALREGLVLDYVARHLPDLQIRKKVPDPRRRSVLDLARKCEWNELHSMHVTKLALDLFDALRPLHRLGPKERELFQYAAMLHDIGWHISDDSHHKHSMYLILNGGLQGFSPREISVMGNVARYHRRSLPKLTHDGYVSLSRDDRRIVNIGASLLRIADGLDRSHSRLVHALKCRIGKQRVRVIPIARGDIELELWAARRKTDLFKEAFGRDIEFEQPLRVRR